MLNKKGFAQILLLVFIVIMIAIGGVGYYIYSKTSIFSNSQLSPLNPSIEPSPLIIATFLPSPTPLVTTIIKIKGDENCKLKTNDALNLLENRAQIYYSMVIKYVGIIECVNKGSGMFAWESPPRFQVGKATYEAGVIWYAGVIVHDACHSKLYHDYLSTNTSNSVPTDVWSGKESERKCLDIQINALEKIGADQNTLDYVKDAINTDYWNDNDRWW